MNTSLTGLIHKYQTSVRNALIIMRQSGIKMPSSRNDWLKIDIPTLGELKGGIPYFKHGFGCKVTLPTGEVDFDFGDLGEIDGFDIWRLKNFAGINLQEFGFDTEAEFIDSFNAAVDADEIVYSESTLYYFANYTHSYAVEIDSRSSTDRLPIQSQDRVLTLYSHYFLAADLMRENYEKLCLKRKKKGNLSRNDNVYIGIYLSSWLGFLAVTCEGFNHLKMYILLKHNRPQEFGELIPKCHEIIKTLKLHSDILREFRNNVFHLRENTEAIHRFFSSDADRLPWADELHIAFYDFFSDYRVLCEAHYFMNNRIGESQIRNKY